MALQVVNSSSSQGVGQSNYGGVQSTYNPQKTAPSTILQNTYNPIKTWNPQQTVTGSTYNDPNLKGILDKSQILINTLGSKYSQPAEVFAPTPDFAAINANARAQAEAAVNPVYTKYLNTFLEQQGQQKNIRTQFRDLAIKDAEDKLAQVLEENTVSGTRAGEDAARNTAEINQNADEFQTDSGQKFATDRLATAKAVANSGLTGGLGAQQSEAAQIARNTTEKRAEDKSQQAREAQELAKVRTFADLERSGRFAGQAKESGVKQAQLNLADFIAEQAISLENKRIDLENQRRDEVNRTQAGLTKQGFQAFFNSISNPAQKNAFAKAYGSLL